MSQELVAPCTIRLDEGVPPELRDAVLSSVGRKLLGFDVSHVEVCLSGTTWGVQVCGPASSATVFDGSLPEALANALSAADARRRS